MKVTIETDNCITIEDSNVPIEVHAKGQPVLRLSTKHGELVLLYRGIQYNVVDDRIVPK